MEKENIKSIVIGFENCTVSQKLSFADKESPDIKCLFLGNITTDRLLNCGRIFDNTVCNKVSMVLDKKCDVHFDEYGHESETTLFQRIQQFSDITDIGFEYEGGETEWIYVPWEADQEYSSGYQHTELLKDGSLHITIEKP